MAMRITNHLISYDFALPTDRYVRDTITAASSLAVTIVMKFNKRGEIISSGRAQIKSDGCLLSKQSC